MRMCAVAENAAVFMQWEIGDNFSWDSLYVILSGNTKKKRKKK